MLVAYFNYRCISISSAAVNYVLGGVSGGFTNMSCDDSYDGEYVSVGVSVLSLIESSLYVPGWNDCGARSLMG